MQCFLEQVWWKKTKEHRGYANKNTWDFSAKQKDDSGKGTNDDQKREIHQTQSSE